MLKVLFAALAIAMPAAVFCQTTDSTATMNLPFHEDFGSSAIAPEWTVSKNANTTVSLSNGYVEFRGKDPDPALIERGLNVDHVTVSGRASQSGTIFVEWDENNWCGIGKVSPTPFGRFYTTNNLDGNTTEVDHRQINFDQFDGVRMELGDDCIRFQYLGYEGNWITLRTIARTGVYAKAPTLLVAGKHFTLKHSSLDEKEDKISSIEAPSVETGMVDDLSVVKTPDADLKMTADERKWLGKTKPEPVNALLDVGTADPTDAQVSSVYPPMGWAREAVGVPEGPVDIGVDWLGRLDVSPWAGPVASFVFGDQNWPFAEKNDQIKRQLQEGYLPIDHLSSDQHGLHLSITVQAYSKDLSPTEDMYAYVCLKVEAKDPKDFPTTAGIVGKDGTTKSYKLVADGKGAAKCYVKYKFPDLGTAEEVDTKEFHAIQAKIAAGWKKIINPAARFVVPDKRMQNAYRAWIAYSIVNTDLVDGFPEPHDGTGFYDQMFGQSVSQYTMAIDLYGMHDLAARILDTQMHYQKPDGSYVQECGLPDLGELMVALPVHYDMTRDKAWLKHAAPSMVRGCEWIINQREIAPADGVTKGLIKFRPYNDYPKPVYNYLGNMLCAMGLEKCGRALGDIGMTSESKAFSEEGKKFRADIMASMDASAFQHDGMTILPIEPDTHRVVKQSNYVGGDYYGLVAGQLMESGFFKPGDKQVTQLIDMMEQRGGLIAGVCEFMKGIDHAYTYGYLMMKMARGDERNVVLGLRGMMAYGMTRDTNSPVEVSMIATGQNHYTLPHTYSVTSQLRLLRNLILREDGDTLIIGQAIPRDWIEPGKTVEARKAPTLFGDVSFKQTVGPDGTVKFHLDPPMKPGAKTIEINIRHISEKPISSVKVSGGVAETHKGETITISGSGKPVDLEVKF